MSSGGKLPLFEKHGCRGHWKIFGQPNLFLLWELALVINVNPCASSFTTKAGGILKVSFSQVPSLIAAPWTADPDAPERVLENPAGTAPSGTCPLSSGPWPHAHAPRQGPNHSPGGRGPPPWVLFLSPRGGGCFPKNPFPPLLANPVTIIPLFKFNHSFLLNFSYSNYWVASVCSVDPDGFLFF